MNRLRIALSLALLWAGSGLAAIDPFMVETKVQTDIEQALSRLILREQYLVHVSTEVQTKSERKIAESEVFREGIEEEDLVAKEQPPLMMPGFTLEKMDPTKDPSKQAKQERQTYRLYETPIVAQVRVHVGLDSALPPEQVINVKNVVQNYLTNAFPNRSVVVFTQYPMLKPAKPSTADLSEEDLARVGLINRKLASKRGEDDEEKKPLTPEQWLMDHALAILLCFIAIIIVMLGKNSSITQTIRRTGKWGGTRQPARAKEKESDNRPFNINSFFPSPLPAMAGGAPFADTRTQDKNEKDLFNRLGAEMPPEIADEDELEPNADLHRKHFLKIIISRSDAFRMYHEALNPEERNELYAVLRGPAYDSFLSGLGIQRPKVEEADLPSDLVERLMFHEKNFAEFVQAKEWQDKQFFGFLSRLSDQQVMTLINHEDPFTVAIMLRFLKPAQSAYCLDQLAPQKRRDVLAQINAINGVPFAEIAQIEKAVRQSVQRFPAHLFGARKEDVEYWGKVLAESQEQDKILEDLEKTNPEIFPLLSKFKFKLDDARKLPQKLLRQILADADNEELGLALTTCPQGLVEFFLGSVSPQRREFLEDQLVSLKGSSKKEAQDARLALTKRFREAMS